MSNAVAPFTPKSGGFLAGRDRARDNKPEANTGPQMLKLDSNEGSWVHGQGKTRLGSTTQVAVNVNTLAQGFVQWKGGRPVDEAMAMIGEPAIVEADLPEPQSKKGWEEQVAFEAMIMDGDEKGTKLKYAATSTGGKNMWNQIFDAADARANDGKPFHPVVVFSSGSYTHDEHGLIYYPKIEIVDWVGEGNAAAEAPVMSEEEYAAAEAAATPKRKRPELDDDDIPF